MDTATSTAINTCRVRDRTPSVVRPPSPLGVPRHTCIAGKKPVEQGYRGSEREWRSPLSMARQDGHTAVIELLLAAGAQ